MKNSLLGAALVCLSLVSAEAWAQSAAINADFYVQRERDRKERLPWDFIDHGIDKTYLWNEYRRAREARTSKPCPMDPDKCRVCGVCR